MRLTPLFVTAAALALGPPAEAGPFHHLWVFGDSTVDTGWYNFRPSGESQFDNLLSLYNQARPRNNPPTYGMGKGTSNPGPVSVEVLAELLGTEVLPADELILPQTLPLPAFQLPAVQMPAVSEAEPAFIGQLPPGIVARFTGTNYATGGARNHDTNPPGSGLFPNAVPTDTQIANYLAEHHPHGHSLYVINSGGNDVSFAINSDPQNSDPEGDNTYVSNAADSLAQSIASLQAAGAAYIVVTNLPEGFGSNRQQSLRATYNTELMSQLNNLGVNFAWADLNGVRSKIVANPGGFGMTFTDNAEGDRACTDPPSAPSSPDFGNAWAYVCSPSSPVSQPRSDFSPDRFLFADKEHWATGGHKVLGSYYFCLVEQTWPQVFPHLTGRFHFPIFGPQPPTPCSLFQPIVVTGQ